MYMAQYSEYILSRYGSDISTHFPAHIKIDTERYEAKIGLKSFVTSCQHILNYKNTRAHTRTHTRTHTRHDVRIDSYNKTRTVARKRGRQRVDSFKK
jgi:hypothetical protein